MSRSRKRPAKSARILRRIPDLVAAGLVPAERRTELEHVAARYAVAITPHLASLIDPADPADPIARQFVPDARELARAPEERVDPIGDLVHTKVKGIVHRYPDRVLLSPVQVCPVYCRFCFRRETVGPGGAALSPAETASALDYIRARREIREVILTGGDPLVLTPRKLGALIAAVAAIPHVQVIRIHTRAPVAQPEIVTRDLVRALATEKALLVVLHCNHPREITIELRGAALRLVKAGIPLFAQTVLLREVNDDVDTLEALFRALIAARITPYYLHHADLAPGTAHFRTSLARGRDLMRRLRGRLSGLAQPAYVLDIPGGHGKVPVGPHYVEELAEGWFVEDPAGRRHPYPPSAE
jgi:lysine 2,3-aminomutase